MYDADGKIGHAEVEVGGFVVMMFDAKPGWPSTSAYLRIYVADAQRAVDEAVTMGARG